MSSSSKLRQFSRQFADQEDKNLFLNRSGYSADKFGFGSSSKSKLARSSEPPPDPPSAAVVQQFKAHSSNANAPSPLDRIAIENRFSRSIGRRVCVSGEKLGTLRYFGPLHVADGLFCGVELDEELGQHDGFVDGRRYFKAAHNRGIFAPLEKVSLLSSPPPSKPNLAMNNRDRFDSPNENSHLNIQNNNCTTPNLPVYPPSDIPTQILPLEYITDVEPHLMSNSMLDEEPDIVELPSHEDLLSQSFEQFLRQSKVFSTESSMIRSSGQFSSDVDHSMEEQEQSGSLSTEINNQTGTCTAASNMDESGLSRDDTSAVKTCLIGSSTAIAPVDKHYKRTDTFNIEELESLNASPQLLVEPFEFNQTISDKDDQENELLTPIFDHAFNLRITSEENSDSNNENMEPAPKRTLVSSTPFNTVVQQSILNDKIPLNTSYVKEKTAPDSSVEENISTRVNQMSERPASTISADTGYQGDTECEMSNGSTSVQNQMNNLTSKTQHLNSHLARAVASETPQDTDLSECSVKLVYSDRKGNVRKVVLLENHAASGLGQSIETATNLTPHITVVSKNSQDIAVENPLVATPLRNDKKTDIQSQQQQRSPVKSIPSSNGVKTVSKNVMKLPLSDKNSTPANENGEFKKPRIPLVKEPEPKPARVKPAPKPSKNAEIMAKLQQSIAQEKVKPKKEVKSRVFVASEAVKDEHVSSKNHSRASSVTTSVQNSPMDGAVSTISGAAKTSPSGSAPSETVMNGVKKPTLKIAANASKLKTLPTKREHASVGAEINNKKSLTNAISTDNKRIPPAASSRVQSRATVKNVNPLASSQANAKQIGKIAVKGDTNLEKLGADLALAERQIRINAKGFEVLAIVFHHLIVNLETTLQRKSIDLTNANLVAQNLGEEKANLMKEITSIKEQHENTINAMRNEHKEKIHLFERAMNAEHDKKIFDARNNHEKEIRKLMEDFIAKEQELLQLNEASKDEDMKQHFQELSSLKISHEKAIEELKQSFAKDMEDLKLEFNLRKVNYEEKLQETSKLAEKYKDEARKLEESLLADVDKRMQDVNERIANYKKDNDSLKVVVDLKNTEIHELRVKCQVLEKESEKYRMLKSKVVVLEQKNTELKEALELKKSAERRLSQRQLELQQTCERERDRAQRLCMTNEQLQYRLQSVLMSQSAYETPMSRFPSDELSKSCLASSTLDVFGDCSSTIGNTSAEHSANAPPPSMTQSLIQIYANNSPRSSHSKRVPVKVYTKEGIVTSLCFDKSCDGKSSQKRRSVSERAASSHCNSGGDDCSPYRPISARSDVLSNAEKRAALAPNKRRVSPFRSPGPCGSDGQTFGPSGLPGVETVIEETTSSSAENRSRQHSSENVTISPVVAADDNNAVEDSTTSAVLRPSPNNERNDEPKMPKKRHSCNGGVFYLTDSGVFTSSLHSSQENFTKQGCMENRQSPINDEIRNPTPD